MPPYLLRRDCLRLGNDGKFHKDGQMVRADGLLPGNLRYRDPAFREGLVDRQSGEAQRSGQATIKPCWAGRRGRCHRSEFGDALCSRAPWCCVQIAAQDCIFRQSAKLLLKGLDLLALLKRPTPMEMQCGHIHGTGTQIERGDGHHAFSDRRRGVLASKKGPAPKGFFSPQNPPRG